MSRSLASIALALSLAPTPGCATLLASGPSQVDVRVEGPSEGAVVTLQGSDGSAPIRKHESRFQVTLDRHASYGVLVTADGYEPSLARLRSDPHPVGYLNLVPELVGLAGSSMTTGPTSSLLFWGGLAATLAMAIVDESTRSARRHETQTLVIPMKKRTAAPSGATR